MKKNNPTPLTEQPTKTVQLLSEITELLSVKHVTKFKTSQNYLPAAGETNFGPSQTQPNDVMGVREILERFTRGLPLNTGDVGYYDDPEDIDLSDFDAMDKFEKEMYIRENREYINDLEKRAKESENQGEELDPKQKSEAPQSAEGDKPPMSGGQDPTPEQ